MSLTLATVPAVRFHISLNVSDLDRSVRFYQTLFDVPPAKRRADYAKFEPNDPPLVVSLEPNGRVAGGGALNHLGIRLADARSLVAVQERLERAGIRTQREEGVECCYAKQTKFWLTDPDGALWEMYTLDDDTLDHRGAGQSQAAMGRPAGATWEHTLGQPTGRTKHCDASLDEVVLRGSFNLPLGVAERDGLLAEAVRVLKPGGRLFVRILSGDREHPSPALGGPAAAVQFVPAKDDVMGQLAGAGLTGLRLLQYDDPPCFVADGVNMRATHIEAFKT